MRLFVVVREIFLGFIEYEDQQVNPEYQVTKTFDFTLENAANYLPCTMYRTNVHTCIVSGQVLNVVLE